MIYAFGEEGEEAGCCVKIGYTSNGAQGVHERLKGCQTGNARRLAVYRVYDMPWGDGEIRRLLTWKSIYPVNGEWYREENAIPALHDIFLELCNDRLAYRRRWLSHPQISYFTFSRGRIGNSGQRLSERGGFRFQHDCNRCGQSYEVSKPYCLCDKCEKRRLAKLENMRLDRCSAAERRDG